MVNNDAGMGIMCFGIFVGFCIFMYVLDITSRLFGMGVGFLVSAIIWLIYGLLLCLFLNMITD